jgi:hypothetical protein
VAALGNGFLELGPDGTAPTLTFAGPPPATQVAVGTIVRGSFQAADAPPGSLLDVGWSYYENDEVRAGARCPVPAGADHVECAFQVTLGKTLVAGDVVRIVADATDAAASRNHAEASLSLGVRDRPRVLALSPTSGGTAGGTDIIVSGTGFVAGSQAVLDDELLFPNGGILVDENTISGHVPAHAAGPALLVVRTPLGDAAGTPLFTYLPPPTITAITPDSGAAAGGTAVTISGANFNAGTRVYFGASLDSAAPLAEPFLQNGASIIGRTPAGSGRTTVWACDGALGFTKLQDGFTWRTP